MKVTVSVLGADRSLVERLTASARRKLSPKLGQIASSSSTSQAFESGPDPASVNGLPSDHDGFASDATDASET